MKPLILILGVFASRVPFRDVENLKLNSIKSKKLIDESLGCWHVAADLMTESDNIDCNSINEMTKSYLSLSLTKCHMKNRLSLITAGNRCSIFTDDEESSLFVKHQKLLFHPSDLVEDETSVVESLINEIAQCKSALSDTAFLVFVEFYNHVDNICFYVQSTMWQDKTESLINMLGTSSLQVLDHLDMAKEQQEKLLEDANRLQSTIEFGQERLKDSFGEMRQEVYVETKKLQDVFKEVFSMFSRVLDFQRAVSGQLHDFSSVFFYLCLVISTHHFTGVESTKRARVPIFLIWVAMLVCEMVFQRCYLFLESMMDTWQVASDFLEVLSAAGGIKNFVWKWRLCCVCFAFWIWVSIWWKWKDPFEVYSHTLRDNFVVMQSRLLSTIRNEISALNHAEEPLAISAQISKSDSRTTNSLVEISSPEINMNSRFSRPVEITPTSHGEIWGENRHSKFNQNRTTWRQNTNETHRRKSKVNPHHHDLHDGLRRSPRFVHR